MAERSGFFPYVSGDANSEYDSAWLAGFVASFIGNGVYDGDLAVAAGSNMQIIIPSGRAWINGYHYRNDGNLALAIDNADGVLNRKDTVVLRWDINARSITAQVLKGTPASTATAPAIIRTVEQYDLKLAEISIPAGTTAITQALITDTRLDKSACGIVTGVVQQVDTTKLYQQIQDDLAGFKSTNEAGFTTWVNGLKEVLDDSTAGNLLNLINTHKSDSSVHITQLTCTTSGTVHALTGLTATAGIAPCVFKADATYAAGNTFTVGGTAYTVVTSGGEALRAGVFLSGDIVGIKLDIDNKKLYIRQDSAAQVGAANRISIANIVNPTSPTDLRAYLAANVTGIGIARFATSECPNITGVPLSGYCYIEFNGFSSGGGATVRIREFTDSTKPVYECTIFNATQYSNWKNVSDGGHAATADNATWANGAANSNNTETIANALTVTTAAPTGTLGVGKLWGVY